jgi:hypothetical protein
MLPRAFARRRPSAVRMRIRSHSMSGSPPRMAIISRPVLVAVAANGSASELNWPPAARISLTMANWSKVERAVRSIRVTITKADLEPTAYGYRPRRSATEAIQRVLTLLRQGYTTPPQVTALSNRSSCRQSACVPLAFLAENLGHPSRRNCSS